MYCYKCGKAIHQSDNFCTFCGAKQEESIPKPVKEVSKQDEITLLVSRAMQGDDCVWGEIYEKTYRYVYYMTFKFLRSEQDAQDITQEVYMQIMRSIGQLKNANSFFGWLRSVIFSKCRDLVKKKSPTLLNEENIAMLENTPEIGEDFLPEAVLDDSETRCIILKIIDSLPYLQRQTVMFYYYDELTVSQIAELMDCSDGTVKSRLNYARKQIKLGVEEQEAKGVKLHGAAGLPILSIILKEQAASIAIPEALSSGLPAILSQAGSAASASANSANAVDTAGKVTGITSK